ncbi:hypothetical protein ACHAXA_005797 [Cyclostephanos tholiformis]|uniref:Uncharacterized protein n=1 Tax=Cyclostephanos tholiformis TaxID=382380 RepID=A0ABD3RCS7_9STRA
MVTSTRKKADEKGITSNDHSNTIIYFEECFEIDAFAYLRVLEAYATSPGPGSSQKSEYWIGALERHYSAATELFYATYGKRLDAPQSNPPDAAATGLGYTRTDLLSSSSAKRNQSMSEHDILGTTLSNQCELAAAVVRSLQPTVDCYNAVIEVWASDKDPISVVRSRRWLSKLEDEAKNAGNHSIIRSTLLPNSRSYDLYLRSCSRGIGKQAKLHRERAEEAEGILHYRLSPHATLAIRPNTESFNYVLRAWTRCRNEASVAARVMNLVLMMERIQKEFVLADEKGVDVDGDDLSWKRNISPDTKSYTMALDGWIIKAGIKAKKWRSYRIRALNSLKNANNQRGRESSGGSSERSADFSHVLHDEGSNEMEKAETILKYIHDLDRIGHSDVRATVIGYNTLLSGWARLANEFRPTIPLKSEKILHDMIALAEQGNKNAAPDVTSFNAVIKAWGRTKQANNALRCEFWLRRMIREGGTNFIAKPDVSTFNLCMDAHLNVGDALRVEDLLIEMDATNDVSPNSETYSKVIRAWLDDEIRGPHYGLPGSSCIAASNWLQKLLEKEKSEADKLGPAPELFSAILKAAAKTTVLFMMKDGPGMRVRGFVESCWAIHRTPLLGVEI